jgi:hypothetical protein
MILIRKISQLALCATILAGLTGQAYADGCAAGNPERQIIYQAAGTGAASTATATATAPNPVNAINVTALEVTGLGATGAGSSTCTITGLQPSGTTLTYYVPVPAGATLAITPLILNWGSTCPLSGVPGTNVVAACTTFGAGNTASSVVLHYFVH